MKRILVLSLSLLVTSAFCEGNKSSNFARALAKIRTSHSELTSRVENVEKVAEQAGEYMEKNDKRVDKLTFELNALDEKVSNRLEVLEAGRGGNRNEFVNSTRVRLETLENYVKILEEALNMDEPSAPTLEEIADLD
jgi:BMFP domain-containing protein YqiC